MNSFCFISNFKDKELSILKALSNVESNKIKVQFYKLGFHIDLVQLCGFLLGN